LKKAGLIIALILSLLFGAVLIVPSFIDWNAQKGRIETAATDAIGQRLQIDGDLSLSLLPAPKLKAEGLQLGDEKTLSDGPAVSAGLLEVRVALLPLLSGNIEAKRIVLKNADIKILTGQTASAPEDQTSPPSEATTPDISLPSVQIENAKITAIDASTGSKTSVSDIDMEIAAQSLSGPFELNGAVRFENTPLDLSAKTGDLKATDVPFELRLSAQDTADAVVMITGTAKDVFGDALRIDGRIEADTPDVGQVLNAVSAEQTNTLSGQKLHLDAPFRYGNQTAVLDDISLVLGASTIRAAARAELGDDLQRVRVNITGDTLDLKSGQTPPATNQPTSGFHAIEASLPANVDATVTATFGQVVGLAMPLEAVDAGLRLRGGQLTLERFTMRLPGGVNASAKANLRSPNDRLMGNASATLQGANAQKLLQTLLGEDAALPPAPTPIKLSLDSTLEADSLHVKALVGSLGASHINASGKLKYGDAPNLEVLARIDELNLDEWLSDAPPQTPQAKTTTDVFNGILRFDLGIDRLVRGGETFKELSAKGRIEGSRIRLDSAQIGKPGDAFISISGVIDNFAGTAPVLDLAVKAQAANSNTLLALAGVEPAPQLAKAGALDASGRIAGTSAAPSINGTLQLGDVDVSVQASATGIAQGDPVTRGKVTLKHPNLARLLSRLDIIDKGQAGPTAEVLDASFDFQTSPNKVTLDGGSQNTAGAIKLRYIQTGNQYDIGFNANAPSLDRYLSSQGLQLDLAGANLGGLNVAVDLGGPAEALSFKTFSGAIGPATLKGTGTLNIANDVPVIALALKGNNLDLAQILPEPGTGAQQAYDGTGERWSKEPIDGSTLALLDGRVTLDFDRLTFGAYELTDALVSLSSEGRTLRMALDRGKLFGAPAQLAIKLDSTAIPRGSLDVSLDGGDIAKATMASAAIAPLTGTFNLKGSFQGRGESEYAMVQSLTGNASISAQDGVIDGVDIERVNQRFGNLSTVNDFLRVIGSALRGGQTPYRLIAVDVKADKGILTTNNMRTVIDGGAQATLDSRIDLPDWQVTARGAFSLEDHPTAPPVGVSIQGPLDHAQVSYDTKRLQEFLALRLGVAVFKGVRTGEGIGLKDLLSGGQQPEETQDGEQPTETPQRNPLSELFNPQSSPADETEEDAEPPKPEEQIKNLILDSIFGGNKK